MKKLWIPLLAIALIITSGNTTHSPGYIADKGCMECHGDLVDNKVVHPILEMGCEMCHETTGEKHPGRSEGFKLTEGFPVLCHQCHDEKNTGKHVHSPVSEGDCSICHSPHSSSYKSLIHSDFSDNACMDCHYVETEYASTVHGPIMDGDCKVCHDPHQSDFSNMIKKEPKQMCLSCHNEDVKKGDRIIVSIGDQLVPGNTVHGPILKENCNACHVPHSGDHPYLLAGNYPVRQYSESTVEKFELCFQCHNSELMTEETTKLATNFRNGTQNLHFLHINGDRGRNCHLCHNPHGAPNDHILEDKVLFGKWEMPMNLELTETGGSCATGCHKRLEYSRISE